MTNLATTSALTAVENKIPNVSNLGKKNWQNLKKLTQKFHKNKWNWDKNYYRLWSW